MWVTAHQTVFLNSPLPSASPHFSLQAPPPWQLALFTTWVHGWLLLAAGKGTGVSDTGRGWWPVGAPLGGHVTSLSKEVVERVTQIGNVMLVEAPVLLLCLSQTLHQFCKQRSKNFYLLLPSAEVPKPLPDLPPSLFQPHHKSTPLTILIASSN